MEPMLHNFTITEEPAGSMYRELLMFATSACNQAILVVRQPTVPPLASQGANVLLKLQPFLLGQEDASSWPGTVLLYGRFAAVYRYQLDTESAKILADAAPSLYSWLQPELPEDLSLLGETGEPWLVTISHERDSVLSLTEEERSQIAAALPWIDSILVSDTSE